MYIFVAGLSHKTAPISVRDRASIKTNALKPVLNILRENKTLSESCVLSTCNRTELYGVASGVQDGDAAPGSLFTIMYPGNDDDFSEYLYVRKQEDAVEHLFQVSAGLDSLALGEPQIFGQVKTAFQAAAENNNTAAILNRLFSKAFEVTKRVRTDTRIGEGTTSISFAAVEMAQKIFGDLKPLKYLIVGAGETGTLTSRNFKERGAHKLLVTNRTFEKAEKLAAVIEGSAIRFDNINRYLNQVDVVVTCMGADSYTILADSVKQAMKERKNRPLFLIDLGAPRDIDPAAGKMYNVFLYDIDDLKEIVETNRESRKGETAAAREIIHEEVRQFFQWYSTIRVLPTIKRMQERFEEIRLHEIEQHKKKLTGNDLEKINLLTRSIVKKLLKEPILQLKFLAQSSAGLGEAEVLNKLFNLKSSSGGDDQ